MFNIFFQAILEQCSYSVEMEVKPKYLVPDTNCFIDYLPYLRSISEVTTDTNETLYSLMVPLIGEYIKERNLQKLMLVSF